MADTLTQYQGVLAQCRALFAAKAQDYGASWSIQRPSSATDQLFIKARRIRTLEETGENRVGDSIESEYIGIVNYCIIALMLLDPALRARFEAANYRPDIAELMQEYDRWAQEAETTMLAKNHDYGEVWREMRLTSMTDMLLVRLVRIKQIEDNAGQTKVSEGIGSNYIDMINYAVFALILLSEGAGGMGQKA